MIIGGTLNREALVIRVKINKKNCRLDILPFSCIYYPPIPAIVKTTVILAFISVFHSLSSVAIHTLKTSSQSDRWGPLDVSSVFEDFIL